jgi:hypothetical protein
MFDEMYDYFKLHSAACMMACRPVVIHSVLMSNISTLQATDRFNERTKDERKVSTINV